MNPIDGNALLLAVAKASVPGRRLPVLVEQVQAELGPRLDEYRRRYELVHETEECAVFFAKTSHWKRLGEELGLERREWRAVERAHTEHLRWLGSDLGRREEFETSLEIREAVVVGKE